MGFATRSFAESSIVANTQVIVSGVPLDEATDPAVQREADGALTDPATLGETNGAPRRLDDSHRESIEPAADEEGGRSFSSKIGGRAVLLPLACVAAFLVGFGSVTAVIKLTDRPAQSDAKPVPTTATPSLPVITTPPTSAARATVASEPTPAAPEPVPAPEAAPAPAPRAGAAEPPPPSSSPTTVTTTTPSTTGVGGGAPGKQGGTG
jgi:hypothetical protein